MKKLEVSIPEDVVNRGKPRITFSEKDTKISRKEKTHDKKGRDDRSRDSGQKSCELCKMMKGEDNPAWKARNTEYCRSTKFYKKRCLILVTDRCHTIKSLEVVTTKSPTYLKSLQLEKK